MQESLRRAYALLAYTGARRTLFCGYDQLPKGSPAKGFAM
jgi:hypothetical protein